MINFFVYTFVVIATLFGTILANPINMEQRSNSGLSCGSVIQNTNKLGYGSSFGGTPQFTLGQKSSNGGQLQVTQLTDGAETLNVNIRYCNSTHLGISGDTTSTVQFNQKYGYVSFGKIFLADDESKCLQRHSTLPSSNPNQETHITIEDCSNVDDSTQARQFWYFQLKYNTANPIVESNGNIDQLPLLLSNTSPAALLTSRNNPDPNGGDNSIIL
jgi:hypothetical protein